MRRGGAASHHQERPGGRRHTSQILRVRQTTMMKFTEYVVLERAAQAIDPLGFRGPGGVLQDLLFPQFTVLTLHPAYLSALCCFRRHLEDEPVTSRERAFARDFRVLELLWGIANARVDSPVINKKARTKPRFANRRKLHQNQSHPSERDEGLLLTPSDAGAGNASVALQWAIASTPCSRLVP